jgi:hypothetical protein
MRGIRHCASATIPEQVFFYFDPLRSLSKNSQSQWVNGKVRESLLATSASEAPALAA